MTIAGDGAAEQARRAAQRVDDLQRRLAAAERQQRAWAAGAEGERLVAAELDRLTADGWVVLHDVHWPGRPRANLDHVAVGPAGAVVIDAKNWSGHVTVPNGRLRCGGYGRDRELEGVASATAAVAALLAPEHRAHVRGLLCLVQQDVGPTRTGSGIMVVGRGQLVDTLRSAAPRLSPSEQTAIASRLRGLLCAPTSPAQLTTARLAAAAAAPVHHEPAARTRQAARRRPAMPSTRPSVPLRQTPHRTSVSSGTRAVLAVLLKLVVIFWITAIAIGVVPRLMVSAIPAGTPQSPASTAPQSPAPGGVP